MPAMTKTFPPHATIFSEGDEAEHAFVVVRGCVEIVLHRAGKTITLDTMGPGQCFGEMGPLSNQRRIAGARTKEATELLQLGADDLKTLLNQSTPVARTVVQSLVDRVKRLDEAAIQGFTPKYSMVALARLLVLLADSSSLLKGGDAKADPKGGAAPAAKGGGSPAAGGDIAKLPYDKAVEYMTDVLCTVGYRIKDALQQMADINLLTIEAGPEGRFIRFRSSEIIENATRMEKSLGTLLEKRMTAEVEMCDIDELARHAGLDADKAFRKLVAGEVPRELFLLRKQMAIDLVKQHGADIFERRRMKRPSEFETLDDLEFLDDDALRTAFTKLETLEQATLVKGARTELASRLNGLLSQRIREIVEKAAHGMSKVDEVKLRVLERKLIDQIKTDAGAGAAS